MVKTITILGSTGTIGQNTLSLIRDNRAAFKVETLIARQNYAELAKQAEEFSVENAVIEDESQYENLKAALAHTKIKVHTGKETVEQISSNKVDLFLSGAVGFCALKPTLAAIRTGSAIGLANKECLVCAGDMMIDEATKHNSKLLPIDSEHNSLYQVFDFENPKQIEKITLTASGGPFRNFTVEQMQAVTPQMAVNHPNWVMGAKISVDSATMMNKGLEVIEAYHLFPVEREQIDIIIHPESLIHGIVHYTDGSMLAGLSYHDMRIPISLALGYPERLPNNSKRIDLGEIGKMSFFTPDAEKFPAIRIARTALMEGSSAPTALNAANEIAVSAFLENRIKFTEIAKIVEKTIENTIKKHNYSFSSIDDVFTVDEAARKYAQDIISSNQTTVTPQLNSKRS
jgi:1-deoxy-D-xylulose-5-phosphate reductoisomerase